MKFFKTFLLFLLLLNSVGSADELRPSFLQIKALGDNNYDIVFKIPAKHKKLKDRLKVEFEQKTKNINEPVSILVDDSYIKNWRLHVEGSLAGTKLKVNGLSSSTKIILRIINEDKSVSSSSLSPSTPEYTFISGATTYDTIKTYTKLGVEHILEGIDHLLFVACLVIIAGTFRKLLWTITGFTLAHSITLFLSAMDVVHVQIAPIEAAIALSIVFLALEIVRGDDNSLTYKYPGLVSSSFGLLHGFGFASALMEIGLPQTERVVALLFFNVGVEIGQLMFVSVLLVLIKLLHVEISKFVGYIIGSVSMMWLMQRVLVF